MSLHEPFTEEELSPILEDFYKNGAIPPSPSSSRYPTIAPIRHLIRPRLS